MYPLAAMLILSATGIFICRLTILHLMHKDSPLGAKLCGTGATFNCDKVLYSSLGKITPRIHLGDIGLVYFITQALFILFQYIDGRGAEIRMLLVIPGLLACVLTLISLFYQAFIIKAWCKMCLITVGIIWAQALLLILPPPVFSYGEDSQRSALMLILSLALGSAWFFIKPSLVVATEVKTARAKLMLFKKNSNVFRAVHRAQKTATDDLWADDFVLGNRNAPIRLVVALNPYCGPCAREYKELQKLLTLFPACVCVTVRFFADISVENKPTRAVRHLLHEYAYKTREQQPQILERWFATQVYSDIHLHQDDLLKKYEGWFVENQIPHTPTLFINEQLFSPLSIV